MIQPLNVLKISNPLNEKKSSDNLSIDLTSIFPAAQKQKYNIHYKLIKIKAMTTDLHAS